MESNQNNNKIITIKKRVGTRIGRKKRVTNILYRKFLEQELLEPVTEQQFLKALDNIKGKYKERDQAFLTLLYYTGARPAEILILTRGEFDIENGYFTVWFKKTMKKGSPRKLYFSLKKNKHIIKVWEFVKNKYIHIDNEGKVISAEVVFRGLQSDYYRQFVDRKGNIRTIHEISGKLRHYFKKWFKNMFEVNEQYVDIPPYYLRHNRFTIMSSKGAKASEIKWFKGAKTFESVNPYIHISQDEAKRMDRYN